MWTAILSLASIVLTTGFAGVGYVWKRRLERRSEQDAIAIEQARVKFLAEASAIINTLDAAARQRVVPMLEDALRRSLEAMMTSAPRGDVPAKFTVRTTLTLTRGTGETVTAESADGSPVVLELGPAAEGAKRALSAGEPQPS